MYSGCCRALCRVLLSPPCILLHLPLLLFQSRLFRPSPTLAILTIDPDLPLVFIKILNRPSSTATATASLSSSGIALLLDVWLC